MAGEVDGSPFHKLSRARFYQQFSMIDDTSASPQNGFWPACDLHTGKRVVIHGIMHLAGNAGLVRVPDGDIGIGADGKRSFGRQHAIYAGGVC